MKKLLLSIVAIFTVFTLSAAPVYADCLETSVLGNAKCKQQDGKLVEGEKENDGTYKNESKLVNCSCDNGGGSSITRLLNLAVDIMTIGIGILGVVGISIVGIQYLTAGGNEEQTRKAKRRMFEIIIGLVAYAVIYALLKWLGV